jgi:hypothetical protein
MGELLDWPLGRFKYIFEVAFFAIVSTVIVPKDRSAIVPKMGERVLAAIRRQARI